MRLAAAKAAGIGSGATDEAGMSTIVSSLLHLCRRSSGRSLASALLGGSASGAGDARWAHERRRAGGGRRLHTKTVVCRPQPPRVAGGLLMAATRRMAAHQRCGARGCVCPRSGEAAAGCTTSLLLAWQHAPPPPPHAVAPPANNVDVARGGARRAGQTCAAAAVMGGSCAAQGCETHCCCRSAPLEARLSDRGSV